MMMYNQVYLQKDQQFREYTKKSCFNYTILNYDLDLEDSKPMFFLLKTSGS